MATRQPTGSSSSRMNDTLVGAYRIEHEIGKGSFATVYRAHRRSSHALVAIKSVNLAKLNKKLKENLYLEIDILQGLHHPHIVALLGRAETSTHIHLIMEYCELGDLSYFIKKRSKHASNPVVADMVAKYPNPERGGLNEVISRHFLKQLASALQFLRERNFIHRDVKPQNLLLLPSPQYMAAHPESALLMTPSVESLIPAAGLPSLPMLKLADFGFARSLPSTSLAETLCGSPLYMAPEILRYEKYDAKADLWSVGTVMYEMVTGKPPFRAANHVELLRKIEQQADRLPWESGIVVSDDMRSVITGLLKKNPVERISFENFFAHRAIQSDIPNLVGNDRPAEIRAPPRLEEAEPMRRQASLRETRRLLSERETRPTGPSSQSPSSKTTHNFSNHDDIQQKPRQPYGTSPRPQAERLHSQPGPSGSRPESLPMKRPTIHPAATAPTRYPVHEERNDRIPSAGPLDMVRGRSQDSPSPGSSLMNERRRVTQRKQEPRKDEREKAAQDVRDERDYVVVAKEYVEVNAFADELAANARLSNAVALTSRSPRTEAVRRAQTEGSPTDQVKSSPPGGMQIAPSRQSPRPKLSYDRVYGSPTSATSAITKAISNASLRLFGFSGYAPQLLRGQSPPQLYGGFPSLSNSPGITGLIAEGRPGKPSDEDIKIVHQIEELATRSDVVYGFAEVKYKQLIPLAPSMDHGLGGTDISDPNLEDDGLTPDAIVSLSEEALVLYVKSLSLLAKSMAVANAWWTRKKRTEPSTTTLAGKGDSAAAGNRINNAVQWMRSRFNEVLEKAEFSRLKLIDAQKQLPEDHPSHPSNYYDESRLAQGESSTADGAVLSSGITAEKLMYDRAIEMSRSAAINEIANTDLPGCEISYVTALRMLEAVLEKDEDESQRKSSTGTQTSDIDADDHINGINVDDRDAVRKLVTMVRARLLTLRKKMSVIAKHQPLPQPRSRPSSTHSGGATPTIVNTPPK